MKTRLFLLSLFFLSIFIYGCISPADQIPANTLRPSETLIVATKTPMPSPTSEATRTLSSTSTQTATPEILPHSIYYLNSPWESQQVWRLDKDGTTNTQLTNLEKGVDDFSVSPVDGSIALISDNQLFLLDGKAEKLSLLADDSGVDKQSDEYVFRGMIENPVFSPNGENLAYAFNGLHLYDLGSGEDQHVLTNLGNLMDEQYIFAKENYFPGNFSPDSDKLLIIMGYYEGSTLAVMDLNSKQLFTRLRSGEPVCCLFNWTVDGNSVLVSNPYYTGDIPGLWRYDAETGEETIVVPGLEEDGSINFVGWPYQSSSGDLLFFHANVERFDPEVGIELSMVHSDANGSNLVLIRPERFRISEALWSPDGSFVLILNLSGEDGKQLLLVRTDGSPLQVLIEGQQIRGLTWGP